MSQQRRPLIAGNWKMNGLAAATGEFIELVRLSKEKDNPACDILICPPATLISKMADLAKGSSVAIGGQDCHAAESGAHTGDIAAEMIKDAGGSHCIVGAARRSQ